MRTGRLARAGTLRAGGDGRHNDTATITFSAAPGEDNRVTVDAGFDVVGSSTVVTLHDAVAPVAVQDDPGGTCSQPNSHTGICTARGRGYDLSFDLGDGQDTFSAAPTSLDLTVVGGPGADRLDAGPSRDSLYADHADRVSCGAGYDVLKGNDLTLPRDCEQFVTTFAGPGFTGITGPSFTRGRVVRGHVRLVTRGPGDCRYRLTARRPSGPVYGPTRSHSTVWGSDFDPLTVPLNAQGQAAVRHHRLIEFHATGTCAIGGPINATWRVRYSRAHRCPGPRKGLGDLLPGQASWASGLGRKVEE